MLRYWAKVDKKNIIEMGLQMYHKAIGCWSLDAIIRYLGLYIVLSKKKTNGTKPV